MMIMGPHIHPSIMEGMIIIIWFFLKQLFSLFFLGRHLDLLLKLFVFYYVYGIEQIVAILYSGDICPW